MVTTAPTLEVRPVGASAFDEIYPLLTLFNNRKMSRSDWFHMLFGYSWWLGENRGFALYANGVAVGFLGTIFSRRIILGRPEVLCNTSSWIVRKEFRSASIMLLKPVLSLPDCTIVNLTPTATSYALFERLGFKPLESEQFLLAPYGSVNSLRGKFYTDAATLAVELSPVERDLSEQVKPNRRAVRVLLRHGKESCFLIATPNRKKGLTFAEIQYVGNPPFFWQHRLLAHAAFMSSLGAVGIAIDKRFAGDLKPRFCFRRKTRRLYRPAHERITPSVIDGVFSELMALKL
jgi:hypothetical protein